jgi:hypothetical protein
VTAVLDPSLADEMDCADELVPECELIRVRRRPPSWRPCGQPAMWIVRTVCGCCRHLEVALLCDECYRPMRGRGAVFVCSACHRVDQVLDMTAERL